MKKLSQFLTARRRLVRLFFRQRGCVGAIHRVRAEQLSYLGLPALVDLAHAVLDVEQNLPQGMLLEAGCALGGSALVMASAKSSSRPMRIFDTFGQIPPPAEQDGSEAQSRFQEIVLGQSRGLGGQLYYGYQPDLLSKVRAAFVRFGLIPQMQHIRFMPGEFEHTLQINRPVALAHIDCDWYASVKICLERVSPHLLPGGRLIVDDYRTWAGCQQAVAEYFADRRNDFYFEERAELHIIRR